MEREIVRLSTESVQVPVSKSLQIGLLPGLPGITCPAVTLDTLQDDAAPLSHSSIVRKWRWFAQPLKSSPEFCRFCVCRPPQKPNSRQIISYTNLEVYSPQTTQHFMGWFGLAIDCVYKCCLLFRCERCPYYRGTGLLRLSVDVMGRHF